MPATPIRRVGLIGLGKMGLPMARHMRSKGFAVAAHDLNPEVCKQAAEFGVVVVENPREVATASDFVIVVVGFDSEVERVVMGGNGIAAAARAGLIVGVSSTVAPRTMKKLEQQLAGTGIVLLDMPLTRGEPAAEAGQMLVMVGGDGGAFAACKPVLECYASSIFHVGELGAGQVGKMVN